MKHLFRTLVVAALVICSNIPGAAAQQMPPIPVDQNVRIGKLDNGLTYYIRHNELPENRVEFYIAQKVGSIQEEPTQRGLAHFLEHMCFNGTKNFPGNEKGLGIVQWCETKGIKFGTNLNAYTSIDQTVYNISNVPTDNENVVDSCLLILHDWSNAVLLEDEEIDKERKVIHEEWRSRNSGIMRLYTEALPVLYEGSKYTHCMPIGEIDIIDNFKYQELRDYYKKWYRPDLQGIIVVGDIDVDAMEAKIKKTFSHIAMPQNAAERIYYPVPDNQEPLIYIGKDKEIDDPSVEIFFKHDATPDSLKSNLAYMLQDYILGMATDMLNTRLYELRQSPNPPFISAGTYYNSYFVSETKDAFTLSVSSKADGIADAMKAGLAELERVRRFGFTASEYERARAEYLTQLESAYNEREKTKNDAYVNEYVNHFLWNEPTPGIEFEYTTMNQIAPNIPVELINQTIQQGDIFSETNQGVFIAVPDKEDVVAPTKEEVIAMLKGMRSLPVEAYVDKVSNEPLMKEAPQGGKIVKEEPGIYGTTVLTLSNGIKVYVKTTDFKADEIQMRGVSFGGTSLYPNEDLLSIEVLNGVATVGGIGNFSKVDLNKVLAGKKANAGAGISNREEYVYGSSSPKDFETMMQLMYLSVTAPRKDMDTFTSYKTRLKAQLESAQANPLSSINDTIQKVMYGNHPRLLFMQPDMVDQIDYDRVLEIYKERFADFTDFNFYFVGNIDLATTRPLIEQYIGALPVAGRKETFRDNRMDIVKGNVEYIYGKEQQTPMATIIMLYSGKVKYNLKNDLLMSFFNQALDIVFTEEVREKEGGTYGVSSQGSLMKHPKEEALLQVVYQTDPDRMEHLNGVIDREVKKMTAEGPTEAQMLKIKEYMLKKLKDNQKENSYWMGNLNEYFSTGMDATKDYEALVNSITAKDVQKFATQFMKQGNKVTVVMTTPEALK